MHLPCAHLRPASTMGNLELSIMKGTRLISGSASRHRQAGRQKACSEPTLVTSAVLGPTRYPCTALVGVARTVGT